MFAFPWLFGIFGRDAQRARLIQLVKQFERSASLGFNAVESCPLVCSSISLVEHMKEYRKQLLFTQNGIDVLKIEPKPTIPDSVIQNFNWITTAKNPLSDENRLHFILNATSKDLINENDIRNMIKPTITLSDTSVDILAWMISQYTLTLLASTNMEEYSTLGSSFLKQSLELFSCLHVQQIYSVECPTSPIESGKPPNILIYTGDSEQSNSKFKKLKEVFGQCLNQHRYVVYQLKHDHINTQPWQENISLLILATDQDIGKSLKNIFDSYVENGGKLISFSEQYTLGVTTKPSGMRETLQDITASKNFGSSSEFFGVQCLIDSAFEEKKDGVAILASSLSTSEPVIISVSHGAGLAVISLVNLFVDELEIDSEIASERKQLLKNLLNHLRLLCNDTKKYALTTAFLLGDVQVKKTFLESIKGLLVDNCFKGSDMTILFCGDDKNEEEMCPSEAMLPVVTSAAPDKVSFSFQSYKEHLETKQLGQLVIYSEVVTSTQTILNGSLKLIQKLPHGYGLVVLGRQQTIGKGRSGNDWLSPDGCLSFSFPVQIQLDSNLGSRLPYLQHIAALAVVEAVRSLNDYEDVELRIKWPNDIYFGQKTKIGGILVNSSIQGRTLSAVVGIGLNLDNSEPTTCINDILERENCLHKRNLRKLSREQLLARILNSMEIFLDDFQQNGPKNFMSKYHQRWLHSNAQVMLESRNGEMVTVKELDDAGFLSVVTSSNEIISLQPDGNSFDMMRNLIGMKTQR